MSVDQAAQDYLVRFEFRAERSSLRTRSDVLVIVSADDQRIDVAMPTSNLAAA